MRLAFALAALVVASPAGAAAPQVISIDPGKDVRLGVFAVVHKACSTGAAPEIRIARPPSHGVILLQSVTLSTKHVDNCPVVTAPARQITYRPAAGFIGQDNVAFDVVDPVTKQADLHQVTIAVQTMQPKP